MSRYGTPFLHDVSAVASAGSRRYSVTDGFMGSGTMVCLCQKGSLGDHVVLARTFL